MSKPSPEELQPLAEVPTAGLNEEAEGIGQVRDFLARFGDPPSTPEPADGGGRRDRWGPR